MDSIITTDHALGAENKDFYRKTHKSIDEPYMIQAGRLKASYPISFAVSLIAACVYLENATLFHKDPEYLTLEKEINLITLPLNKKLI